MRLLLLLSWLGLLWAQEEGVILRRAPREVQWQGEEWKEYVRGRVIDARSGEPIPGALIQLRKQATYTDSRGYFSLVYERSSDTLYVSFPEYRTKGIRVLRPGEVVVSLEPFEAEVQAVQIVGELSRETETAVSVERLRSLEFGESYTSDQIMRRTTDFYVPNVLRRLPGVSLLSGRWITLRGMGERYNAVSFGLAYPTWLRYDGSMPVVNELVSNLVGRVEVRKVWTPELLGHFGGGMIDFQLPEGGEEGLWVALTGEIGSWGLGQRYPLIRGQWENTGLAPPEAIQASAPSDIPTAENFTYAQSYRRLTVPETARTIAPPGPLVTLVFNKARAKWRLSLRAVYGQRYVRSSFRFSFGAFDSLDGKWDYTERGREWGPVWTLSQNMGATVSFSAQPLPHHQLNLSLLGMSLPLQRLSGNEGYYFNPYIGAGGANISYHYPSILLEHSLLGIGRLRWQYEQGQWLAGVEGGVIGQRYGVPFSGAMNYALYPGDSVYRYEQELWGDYEAFGLTWHSRATGGQTYGHPYVEWRKGKETWLRLRIGGWYSR